MSIKRKMATALATAGLLALAATGAAVGSIARDALMRQFRERWQRADLGILAANLIACAVVGAAWMLSGAWHDFVVLGLAGGLSTWSSLAVEVAGAVRSRAWGRVALHVPGAFAVALGVLAATAQIPGTALERYEFAGELALETLSDHLSALADLILAEVLRIVWRGLRTRHCEEPRFAVIAYGKLGGAERKHRDPRLTLVRWHVDRGPIVLKHGDQRLAELRVVIVGVGVDTDSAIHITKSVGEIL